MGSGAMMMPGEKRGGLKNQYMKKWRVLRLICSISFPLNKKRIGGS
jgi:hypothetical protein